MRHLNHFYVVKRQEVEVNDLNETKMFVLAYDHVVFDFLHDKNVDLIVFRVNCGCLLIDSHYFFPRNDLDRNVFEMVKLQWHSKVFQNYCYQCIDICGLKLVHHKFEDVEKEKDILDFEISENPM